MEHVDVLLVQGTDKQQFIDSFNDNDSVELVRVCNNPRIVVLKINPEYITTLRNNASVESASLASECPPTIPSSLPAYETYTGTIDCRRDLALHVAGVNSTDLMSYQLYMDQDTMPINVAPFNGDPKCGNHQHGVVDPGSTTGALIPNRDGAETIAGSYTSCFFGEHVDVVVFETGYPVPANVGGFVDGSTEEGAPPLHPDFADPDNLTQSRFVPVDWPGFPDASGNPGWRLRQITNPGRIITPHGARSLSAACGRLYGFAKKANVHFIALLNGTSADNGPVSVVECLESVQDWHSNKPNNPTTGVPNPTILFFEFQYLPESTMVPVESISSINHLGVTTNRPPGGWGSNLQPFIDNNMIPSRFNTQDDGWVWAIQTKNSATWDTTPALLREEIEDCFQAGIHVFTSAGNQRDVYCKFDDPDYNSSFTVDANSTVYNWHFTDSTIQITSVTSSNVGSSDVQYFPFRAYGPHGSRRGHCTDVGAVQNSEWAPILDGYSNRGVGIDICAGGEDSLTVGMATGALTPADGHTIDMFDGTSAAVPQVVGKAACELEKYFHYNGRYPTPSQLQKIIKGNAREIIVDEPTTDWTNVIAPDVNNQLRPRKMQRHIDSLCLSADIGTSMAFDFLATDLCGTTNKRVFFNGKGFERTQTDGVRPAEGAVYPRPKIRRS